MRRSADRARRRRPASRRSMSRRGPVARPEDETRLGPPARDEPARRWQTARTSRRWWRPLRRYRPPEAGGDEKRTAIAPTRRDRVIRHACPCSAPLVGEEATERVRTVERDGVTACLGLSA